MCTLQTLSLEDQQDVMNEVSSFSSKLHLLSKMHDIELKEKENQIRNQARRNEKAILIKEKNDYHAEHCRNELVFSREEKERRDLISKIKEQGPLGLSALKDILVQFEGILITYINVFIFIYVFYFNDIYYYAPKNYRTTGSLDVNWKLQMKLSGISNI